MNYLLFRFYTNLTGSSDRLKIILLFISDAIRVCYMSGNFKLKPNFTSRVKSKATGRYIVNHKLEIITVIEYLE